MAAPFIHESQPHGAVLELVPSSSTTSRSSPYPTPAQAPDVGIAPPPPPHAVPRFSFVKSFDFGDKQRDIGFHPSVSARLGVLGWQLSTLRTLTTQFGKIPCIYANCIGCDVPGQCKTSKRFLLMKKEVACEFFGQPMNNTNKLIITEESKRRLLRGAE